jgi:hypothetical protein
VIEIHPKEIKAPKSLSLSFRPILPHTDEEKPGVHVGARMSRAPPYRNHLFCERFWCGPNRLHLQRRVTGN